MGAGDVAARCSTKRFGLSPTRLHQLAQHVPQAGEVLEGAQLQHLVEQERRRVAVGGAGPLEEGERAIEGIAGVRRRRHLAVRRDRDRRTASWSTPRGRTARACWPPARRRCTGSSAAPSRSTSACRSVVRPVPQPPSTTGTRDGAASSAARMRRSMPACGAIMTRDSIGTRTPRAAGRRRALPDSRRRRGG